MNTNTYILSARRSAIGRFGGALKDLPLHIWGSRILQSAVEYAGVDPQSVEQVITGRCFGTENRRITLEAGLPPETVSSSVYQACASGMVALHHADRLIRLGEADVVAAGGVEHMSAVPYLSHHTRWGARLGHAEMEDWLKTGLSCPVTGISMGETGENIRRKHQISREDQDAFAHASQEKAARAIESGFFKKEIEPLEIPLPKGQSMTFDTDEHPRLSSVETLAKLKPAFEKDGTVTAGNSSGINDAAAYLVCASEDYVEAKNLKPLARVVSHAVSGLDPKVMGLGPVLSMQKALDRAGLTVDQIDLFEINEAFAVQVLGVVKELPLPMDRLNVNGGAIALGHPVGCSGARIMVTLLHELQRRGLRRGLAGLCVGGGMGAATVVELL